MKFASAKLASAALPFVLATHVGWGATFRVTSAEDSGPGSLRQAILDVNATPGPHRVEFLLPGGGVHTLAPLTGLPAIVNPVVIDGYTQPGSRVNTLPWGNDAALLVRLDGINATNFLTTGLILRANNCTVRGLIIVRFDFGIDIDGSSDSVVAGNWIGVDFDGVARGQTFDGVRVTAMAFTPAVRNVIGGGSYADRNVISGNSTGISFFPAGASKNSVIGNFIGADPAGHLPRGNVFAAVSVQAATNISVLGNMLAASTGAGGCGLKLLGTSGIIVQRNLVGLAVDFGDLGHFGSGISAQGVTGLQIGAENAMEGNRIGCNRNHGIELLGCAGAVIQGNIIGSGSSGAEPLGNLGCGVLLNNCSTNKIGPGNQIVYNGRDGVLVASGTGNEITANQIFDNGGLGIALGTDSVTANDPGDGDSGPNELQNYPVLSGAEITADRLVLRGTLDTAPAGAYRLEFYASRAWDPLGIAEGQVYLGSVLSSTDGAGSAQFSFSCPNPGWLAEEDVVTATATDQAGNTSEFSLPCGVARPPSLWIVGDESTVSVHWLSAARKNGFALECSSAVQARNWTRIEAGINDNGTTCSFILSDVSGATNFFFRLAK